MMYTQAWYRDRLEERGRKEGGRKGGAGKVSKAIALGLKVNMEAWGNIG